MENEPEGEADVAEVLVVLLARLHVLPLVDRLRQVHLTQRNLHLKTHKGQIEGEYQQGSDGVGPRFGADMKERENLIFW